MRIGDWNDKLISKLRRVHAETDPDLPEMKALVERNAKLSVYKDDEKSISEIILLSRKKRS